MKISWRSSRPAFNFKDHEFNRKGETMDKKIVAVNAGPRKGWNTDTLITEATEGARSAGAEVEKFDLFRLEKYTGCISCSKDRTARS